MTVDEVMGDAAIGLVHLATPPATHAGLALRAFAEGKHVLCEKPLATTVEAGEAMVAAAREADRLLAVNLIMRYDPLLMAVKAICERGLLGKPLRATFENYAKDAALPPGHWFWDPDASGGIFVEHGVHFFDLFNWLFGAGEVLSAFASERPGTRTVEAVGATVRHGETVTGVFHGFQQAEILDRQEMRLIFERGDLRLREWVPTMLEATFFGTAAQADKLAGLLPQVDSRSSEALDGPIRHRWTDDPADGLYRIAGSVGMDKPALYAHVVRELLADALAWTRDRAHVRRVTEADALAALRLAVACRELA